MVLVRVTFRYLGRRVSFVSECCNGSGESKDDSPHSSGSMAGMPWGGKR